MKLTVALLSAAVVGLMATTASAQDRSIGEDSAWRFQSASDRAVRQNGLNQYELNRSGYFDQIRAGNLGALAGAGSLLGGSSANTSNVFQFIDQSVTTNNCSASAVGASLTCGRGDNNVSGVNQTFTGNTQTSSTDISGNTVTNRDNQNQTNLVTGNGGQNVSSGPTGRPQGGN